MCEMRTLQGGHTDEVRRQLQSSDEAHLVTFCDSSTSSNVLENLTWHGCFHLHHLYRCSKPHSLEPASISYFIWWFGTRSACQTAAQGNHISKTVDPGVAALRSWAAFLLFCLTFNSRWSSKYWLKSHYVHWWCYSCAKNLPFSVTAALSGAKADDLIGRDWNQLWHLLIVYSCCITAAPGRARDAPASTPPPPPAHRHTHTHTL